MPLDFNISPPQWLKEAGQWTDQEGRQSFQIGANLAIQKQHLQLQQQKNQQDAVAQQAHIEAAKQIMDFRTQEQAAWIGDIPKIREWLQLTPEQQLSTPLTDLRSKQGMQMGLQFEKAASSSAAAKSLAEGRSTYDKRLAAAVKADPEVGSGLELPANQYPSATNWQSLSLAEERVKVRSENVARQAKIDALARGDVPTTRIDSSGKVQTTFKPVGDQGKEIMPKETTLSDGTTMVYNPKSGHFLLKKDKDAKEFSAPQLLAISKELSLAQDPESKANAKAITDYLSQSATNQIARPKPAKPAAPNRDPLNLFK